MGWAGDECGGKGRYVHERSTAGGRRQRRRRSPPAKGPPPAACVMLDQPPRQPNNRPKVRQATLAHLCAAQSSAAPVGLARATGNCCKPNTYATWPDAGPGRASGQPPRMHCFLESPKRLAGSSRACARMGARSVQKRECPPSASCNHRRHPLTTTLTLFVFFVHNTHSSRLFCSQHSLFC